MERMRITEFGSRKQTLSKLFVALVIELCHSTCKVCCSSSFQDPKKAILIAQHLQEWPWLNVSKILALKLDSF